MVREVETLSERLQHAANRSSCKPGPETTTILGCVSIPTSTATGIFYTAVVGLYAIIAGELIYYFVLEP